MGEVIWVKRQLFQYVFKHIAKIVFIVLEHHMTISKLWTVSPKTYFLIVRIADKKILYIATLLIHDAIDAEVQLRMWSIMKISLSFLIKLS